MSPVPHYISSATPPFSLAPPRRFTTENKRKPSYVKPKRSIDSKENTHSRLIQSTRYSRLVVPNSLTGMNARIQRRIEHLLYAVTAYTADGIIRPPVMPAGTMPTEGSRSAATSPSSISDLLNATEES